MELFISSGGQCGQHARLYVECAHVMAKPLSAFSALVLKAGHTQSPRVITVDKNAAYPKAMETLKGDETLSETTELRQKKYLNIIEQDHRPMKRLVNAGMGFKSFNTARHNRFFSTHC